MGRMLSIRLLRALLTIIVVITFAFLILRSSGDPAQLILGPDAPPAALEAFRHSWGLDRPLPVQYLRYVAAIFRGDLGVSMRDGTPALRMVADRIPATLELMVPALLLNLLIGIPAGVLAALRRGSWVDRLVMLGAVAGFSVPGFVLALVMVMVFAVRLHWLPSSGQSGLSSIVLPVITLGLGGAAVLARFTRSAMLEVLGRPYIRAASAKGLTWRQVVTHHALPNAAIPTVTIVGFMVGGLMAGAVVTESVFAWPGLGQLLVVSVSSRDLAVVQVILLLVAITMVAANLVVDLLYGVLDPRLKDGR